MENLNSKKIFVFWMPLAVTWLMMAVEGPLLAAVIARLAAPKYNLAAYGVAYAIAVFMEAPIIMLMSASTALVHDRFNYFKLRNFAYRLNFAVTLIMALFLFPAVFYPVTINVIGLPGEVARLTHKACLLLLAWPAAIGYRRFYQGILIRSNLTRRVAYGTAVRLSVMALTAILLYKFGRLDGVLVGATALTLGVTAEAVASRIMAHRAVSALLERSEHDSGDEKLDNRRIYSFYYPLALMSMLGLGIQPMVTFFLGKSPMALISLAALPVINSLVFIFRSLGLSFQEVGIALLGRKWEGFKPLRRFTLVLGMCTAGGLILVAFTPLSGIWFHKVSGLTLDLARFSVLPTQILALIPGLMVLLSFQRAIFVHARKTKPITIATAVEVASIILFLVLNIHLIHVPGAVAAAAALITGRFLANVYLFLKLKAGNIIPTEAVN
ncbi:MAG: hypothetical protein JXB26_13500 [Candidatus Aminicenantes bacterium]|nr:hypothetical protein [Candidatus Aminicenantes bacterium]